MSSIALPSEDTTSSLSSLTAENTDPTLDPLTRRNQRNRQNAAHSTGPRTPAGKKTASQNARRHNLAAISPPPDLLANPTFQILRRELMEEFNPNTPAQVILVEQLTFVSWKLDQIPHLERQILATPIGQATPAALPDPANTESPEDYVFRRLADDTLPPPPKDPTNQLIAAHLLQDKPTPLTRLWDHQRRLQARFQSLLRQVQQLKRYHQQPSADVESARQLNRRLAHDDAILDQHIDALRQRNHQRDHQARLQRQQELNHSPTPTPESKSLAVSQPPPPHDPNPQSTTANPQSPPPPAQNEPTFPPPVALANVSSTMKDFPPRGMASQATDNQQLATNNQQLLNADS